MKTSCEVSPSSVIVITVDAVCTIYNNYLHAHFRIHAAYVKMAQCSPVACWSVLCVDCWAVVQVASSLAVGWCSTGDA